MIESLFILLKISLMRNGPAFDLRLSQQARKQAMVFSIWCPQITYYTRWYWCNCRLYCCRTLERNEIDCGQRWGQNQRSRCYRSNNSGGVWATIIAVSARLDKANIYSAIHNLSVIDELCRVCHELKITSCWDRDKSSIDPLCPTLSLHVKFHFCTKKSLLLDHRIRYEDFILGKYVHIVWAIRGHY
jgi:hypothetical protein